MPSNRPPPPFHANYYKYVYEYDYENSFVQPHICRARVRRARITVRAMLFLPFFLINNFSTGGDSPYRSFPHSKGNALNLGKKREEITFNFTIPSHELVVIYSGIDIKQLDKKKKGETPPFRVSVKRSKEARVVYIG